MLNLLGGLIGTAIKDNKPALNLHPKSKPTMLA